MKKSITTILLAIILLTGCGTAGYSTEYFVVTKQTPDGYLDSYSLSSNTNAPNGFILDNKYKIGDIVKVTYKNDDIKQETLVTGKELLKVQKSIK